ncbi:bacteriocin maturation protein [Cohnella caldifontis]|uniref:bacteriocin maturation protein n=1 Tax=Cohnella caldifontis TaxID=3027471 RepID=UPI003BB5F461
MDPSMRPKVSGDAFYLPDPEGIVYFRGNRGSFRMQGPMIDRWIEQLVPMFGGEHTLAELTDGLPEPHRSRVFEIAATLYENGFVRDAGRDRPHRLAKPLLEKYAQQIEFLDAFGGSGAARFEDYRQTRVLAAGNGSILVSLVSALLHSGMPKFRVLSGGLTEAERNRIRELAAYVRLTDPETELGEIGESPGSIEGWEKEVASCQAVLYASTGEDLAEFRSLHEACLRRDVPLLPALRIAQTGVAGPLVRRSDGCWESAVRRLHRGAIEKDPALHAMSPTAEGLLANVLVFELFKMLTEVSVPELKNEIYALDLETLESARHPFLPHPAVAGRRDPKPLEAAAVLQLPSAQTQAGDFAALVTNVSRITSPVTGVFQAWDEGDWEQLPLSLCRVRPADPRSEGPAELLQELVCGGFTHEEARREAALAGIEAYASRGFGEPGLALGAGFSPAEGVGRAIRHLLRERLGVPIREAAPEGIVAPEADIDDERAAFYLRSLTIMQAEPEIWAGHALLGFPVRWVRSGERWYGAVGPTPAMARREALLLAVLAIQTRDRIPDTAEAAERIRPAPEAAEWESSFGNGIRLLEEQGLGPEIDDVSAEPFMKEIFAGVYGVRLKGEEAP